MATATDYASIYQRLDADGRDLFDAMILEAAIEAVIAGRGAVTLREWLDLVDGLSPRRRAELRDRLAAALVPAPDPERLPANAGAGLDPDVWGGVFPELRTG